MADKDIFFPWGKDRNPAVLAVVSGRNMNSAFPHPRNCFAQQRNPGLVYFIDGNSMQDLKLRPQALNGGLIQLIGFFAFYARAGDFGHDFSQGDDAVKRVRFIRLVSFRPGGEFFHPVQHAQGHGMAADRTNIVMLYGLRGMEIDIAFPVSVMMVLAFLRVKFQGT